MISANELRLGNLVCYDPEHPIAVPIQAIRTDGVETTAIKLLSYDDIFPIALTEEFLQTLGLVRQLTPMLQDRPEYRNWRLSLSPQGDPPREGNYFEVYFWWNILAKEVWLGRRQFSVHQLQNYYFALTGEELAIKEPA